MYNFSFIKLNKQNMKHQLPELPYALNDLEPVISKETMEYHYGKHLQGYINNLNKLIEKSPFEDQTLEEIVKTSDGGIYNNAAQTFNHTFFFLSLSPNGGGEPKGKLRERIDKNWGSFEEFKREFTQQAASIFGSGWMWLQSDFAGDLSLSKESNAGCPLTLPRVPILTVDVWEHAYYIDYRNLRADFLEKIWTIINWDVVEKRYEEILNEPVS